MAISSKQHSKKRYNHQVIFSAAKMEFFLGYGGGYIKIMPDGQIEVIHRVV